MQQAVINIPRTGKPVRCSTLELRFGGLRTRILAEVKLLSCSSGCPIVLSMNWLHELDAIVYWRAYRMLVRLPSGALHVLQGYRPEPEHRSLPHGYIEGHPAVQARIMDTTNETVTTDVCNSAQAITPQNADRHAQPPMTAVEAQSQPLGNLSSGSANSLLGHDTPPLTRSPLSQGLSPSSRSTACAPILGGVEPSWTHQSLLLRPYFAPGARRTTPKPLTIDGQFVSLIIQDTSVVPCCIDGHNSDDEGCLMPTSAGSGTVSRFIKQVKQINEALARSDLNALPESWGMMRNLRCNHPEHRQKALEVALEWDEYDGAYVQALHECNRVNTC